MPAATPAVTPGGRRAGAAYMLWIAVGTALVVTVGWSLALTVGSTNGARKAIESLGVTPEQAGRDAAQFGHEFHMQMLWTAVFAAVLLVGWLAMTRHRRARLPALLASTRKGRLGLGVLIGVVLYGVVAFPLVALAERISFGGGSF